MNADNPHRVQMATNLLRVAALISIFAFVATAQDQSQYDHGTPPQHATGISAIGSYISTELGTINLSNGSLNFNLPLGSVGGRGFAMPLTLNYSNKVWSATRSTAFDPDAPGGGRNYPVAFALYDDPNAALDIYNRVAPGWSIGSVPVLRVRGMGMYSTHNLNGCTDYLKVLVKLTLILPDKGEIELRDDASDGSPLGALVDQWGCRDMDGYRGQRWHATDGSGTIFISDVNNGVINGDLNGTVISGDGTRYRIQDPGNNYFGGSAYLQKFGRAISVTDRNGNILNINYPGGSSVQYTDQLGSTTTRIDYSVQDPDPPYQPLAVLVTLPGYNGQNRYYKIKTGIMNQHYRAGINPTLPVINGDSDPLGYGYNYPGPRTALFPDSYGSGRENIDSRDVLTQLVLPDGRSLTFNYNEYGEVAEVVMPTGGKVQYDYAYTSALPAGNSAGWETQTLQIPSDVHQIDRALVARRTYADGSTLESSWSYAYGPQTAPNGTYGCTEVQAHAADNTLLQDQRHFFMNNGRFLTWNGSEANGTGYSLWSTGLELRSETRDAANAVLGASEEDWSQRASVAWSYYTSEQISNDNRVNESRKFLDNGSMAKVQTFYQANVKYNNPVEVKEYDFDQSLKRRTVTTYADSNNLINSLDYTSDSIHLLSLPLVMTVYDGSSNQVAQTTNEYDYYADDSNHALLQDYGSVTHHDINYGASYTTRGNVTRTGRWLNLTNSFIYSYLRYDDLGNVISIKDAKGNTSSISFADDFGNGSNPGGGSGGTYGATYALPTLITSPPPTPGAPVQTARSQYDFSTGLLTGFRDRNNIVTQTIYNDPFDRPTQVKAALGITGVESHAVMYYAPITTPFGITLSNNDVLTARDMTTLDDSTLRSWTHTDGFGRTVQSWSRDPLGDDEVITVYDALSRVKQVSNPFRPSQGENAIYTTTSYDFASRVVSVTTPDSASVTTSYSGNTVTVTDQTSKQRKSVTDGLGRLIQVYEAPNDANYNYLTSYSYDVLDDLTAVSQGSQTRSFIYDSLKRLTSATNPESGTVSYQYDNNGNLTQKTDARSPAVVTTYIYDALNRATTRSYSDGTPSVTYAYDSATNGKGRLASVSSIVSTYSYSSYDALGRALSGSETLGSQTYSLSYSYDLAGHVRSITYPSSVQTVSYAFDAAGRTSSFTGNLGDGTQRTYSSGIIYSSLGGMTKEQFGTSPAVYNKLFYDSRGQLSEIRDSTSYTGPTDTSWDRGAIINHYSDLCWGMCGGSNSTTSMTDNNGNLKKQEVYIPNSDSFAQFYDYDSLNRLQSVRENKNGGSINWQQAYTYDRFGNRTIDQTNTYGTGIPKPNFSVTTGNNRLGVPSGQTGTMTYDSAGNLTTDTYSAAAVTRVYDAENRMTSETQASSYVAGNYSYDGDGRRVKRIVNGTETWQVYGLGGELLAEYAQNGSASSPQKEYGYRNGQLLVTATVTTGWGSPPALNDNPLSVGQTTVQARHITELRAAINGLRTHLGMSAYSWQYSATINDWITANPIVEMRTALDQALGAPSGGYSAGLAQYQQVKAIHLQELRDRVLAAWQSGGGVDIRWLVSDQLGTPRMIFDQSGSLANVSRHDYLPFGEEVFAGTGGRTTTQGYTAPGYSAVDGARQKFTLKERDIETGLDYSINRYYSSTQGRFTGADLPLVDQQVTEPQSWNLYAYSRNNPLRYTDPDGRGILDFLKSETAQKLINTLVYNLRVTNAELAKITEQRRDYLLSKTASDGQLYIKMGEEGMTFKLDPRKMTQFQVNDYYERVNSRDSREFPLTPEMMDTAINLSGGVPNSRVIGKQSDLENPGSLREGERTLDLPDQGSPRANWKQNSSRLREAMQEGRPIRDVSANPATGQLEKNSGFLRAERELLRNRGWRYNTADRSWHPPGQ